MKKQVIALATDDENLVMWDIDSLLSDYEEHPYTTVDTNILIPKNWLSIDKEYALTTDVTRPLILFEIPNKSLFIADGNHRLYRAITENVQKMNVVIIPEDVHLSYLYECSIDNYFKVIDGLQNEGIFISNFNSIL